MNGPGGAWLPAGLLQDATLADLEIAWREREEEAQALSAQGFDSVALSLRLYSLEIRLKVVICKRLDLLFLPKACKTHDLSELIIFTGIWRELEEPANAAIRQHWDRLVDFSKKRLNDVRYLPRTKLDATLLASLTAALDDPGDGVLAWLSRHP
jgi:hypothetical protein